jgi:hypothetical protein
MTIDVIEASVDAIKYGYLVLVTWNETIHVLNTANPNAALCVPFSESEFGHLVAVDRFPRGRCSLLVTCACYQTLTLHYASM